MELIEFKEGGQSVGDMEPTTTFIPEELQGSLQPRAAAASPEDDDEESQSGSFSLNSSLMDLTTAVLQLFESKDFQFPISENNGKRWVGVTPVAHASDEPSNSGGLTEPTPPSCCPGIHSSTTSPGMHKELNCPPEERDEDFSDPLLLTKEVLGGVNDLNCALFPPIHNLHRSVSNGSSPLTTRKHYTIVPMKGQAEVLDPTRSKQEGNEALGLVLSALYGKLLVVMGIAFPMSEVISTYIPPSFYDGFYLYLYFGSITFMICIYGNILRQKATRSVRCTIQRINTMRRSRLTSTNSGVVVPEMILEDTREEVENCDSEGSSNSSLPSPSIVLPGKSKCHHHHHHGLEAGLEGLESGSVIIPDSLPVQRIHFGSFYLRIGAVAFGIGSMIYSGLEFGQYFELDPDTKCHNFMIALTPAVRMIFTFGQMYFIFLNSRMAVSSVRLGAQFGLMHMIGTNMCVWLNVIIQETRHEILHFYNPDNQTFIVNYNRHVPSGHDKSMLPSDHAEAGQHDLATPLLQNLSSGLETLMTSGLETVLGSGDLHRERRGLRGPHSIYECRRTDIMGSLVQNASSFLFPCTIEYSLICAAILYVMWKSIGKRRAELRRNCHGDLSLTGTSNYGAKRSPHHYSVDCARANKGLFVGIFILVMTIISLILFFVLINRPGYQALATLEANVTELILYTTTTVAVLIGMCQVRELRFVHSRNLELDNILLIVAQTGSFIYNVFTIIGGHFTLKQNTALVMMTALASLIQLLFQTLFILDASKRCASTADQARRKPGREIVTFLLVTNLAMWLINTLEKSRADSHPVQLKFYGVWAWTIITHISMPLAIFYRFHSTVCLCEIWKKAFKLKAN